MTRQALIIATIRTAVPGAVGWLLAQLIARIPAVDDVIATIDRALATAAPGVPDFSVRALLSAAAVGATIAGYYWVVRQLGHRWPIMERWLLGSSQQPVYVTQGEDGGGSLPNPTTSTRAAYQAALESDQAGGDRG